MAHDTFDLNNQKAIFDQLNTAYFYLFQSRASELLNQSNESRLFNSKKHRYDDSANEPEYTSRSQQKRTKLFHNYNQYNEANSLDSNSKDDFTQMQSNSNEKLTVACQNILDFIRPNLNQNKLYSDYLDNSHFVPETKQIIRDFENTSCPICCASLNSNNLKSHLENELNNLYELKKNVLKKNEDFKDERKEIKKEILKKIQESRLLRIKNKKTRRNKDDKLKKDIHN